MAGEGRGRERGGGGGARRQGGGLQGGLGSAIRVHVLSDKEHLLCRFPDHKGG